MRARLTSQLRQSTDVCLFCALRWTRDVPSIRDAPRLSRRNYSASTSRRTPAGAALAAREDDEEADFPFLKDNAAATVGSWPTSRAIDRSAALPRAPPSRPPPSNPSSPSRDRPPQRQGKAQPDQPYRFRIGGNRSNKDDDFRTRDVQRQSRTRSEISGSADTSEPTKSRSDDAPTFQIRRPGLGRRSQGSPQGFEGDGVRSSNGLNDSFGQRRTRDGGDGRRVGNPSVRRFVPTFEPESDPAKEVSKKLKSEPETSSFTPVQIADGGKSLRQKQEGTEEGENLVTEQESAPTLKKRMGRFSSRFAVEEEEPEAEMPAQNLRYQKSDGSARTARSAAGDFDYDLWEAEQALQGGRSKKKSKNKKKQEVEVSQRPTLTIPDYMSVQQLAQAMKIKTDNLVHKLEEEGFEGARYDHMLDAETCAMFADIYGFDPVAAAEEIQDLIARPPPADITSLPPRPPIVTIMGHVDHGKTTILDWLRKSSVVAGEHGGITQHIGAFSVTMPGTERQITFLDTPGHEAFLDMRKRGANVTDIVVLVVAADDSVKPQTIEAIKHALDAQVQIIVAINKVDKHDADIDRVKQDLTRHEIVVEDFGGDYQAIPVSGKTGQGMEELEEAIITLADVLDLRAEQEGPAEGQIIESKVTNAGRVATILVRRGVLKVGDFIVAGPTWGRVRTLRNDAGKLVEIAYPGDPVQVDGWRGEDPTAGLEVIQADDEQHAKAVVDLRLERAEAAQIATNASALNATKTAEAEARAKVLEWEAEHNIKPKRRSYNEGWVDVEAAGGPKKVHFVVKADVAGSVEAIVHAVSSIGNHEIHANVVHSGTGQLTESDVRILATSGELGYAISFNQPIETQVKNLAFAADVGILDHNIIYRVTEAVKDKLQDALPPLVTQRVLGEAEVGQLFEIKGKKRQVTKIAGCKVTNGTISRANRVRVIRNGETVYTGTLESLKNVKRDVTEMRKGTECGLGFEEWDEVQEGDQVQCFEEVEEKRKLY